MAPAAAQAAAFAATAPLMPRHAAPPVIRGAFTLLLFPLLWAAAPPWAGADPLIASIVRQCVAGATLGLGAAAVAGAVTSAGDAIDAALGSPPFAQRVPSGGPIALLYELAYATVMLQSGGFTMLVCELVRTGAGLKHPLLSLHGLAALGTGSIRASLLLAGPSLFAQALATLAAGFLTRAAPQLGGMLFAASLTSAFVLLAVVLGAPALWPELVGLVRTLVSLASGLWQ